MTSLSPYYVVPSPVRIENTLIGYLDFEKDKYDEWDPKKTLVTSIVLGNATSYTQKPSPAFLHWTQRPLQLVRKIDAAFEKIKNNTSSQWGVSNGCSAYGTGLINEHVLMKQIILQAPQSQKTFVAVDIGAGNFQWTLALAEFLDAQTDLPKDIKIHIFGLRGETNTKTRGYETDHCKVYNLGAFKIEELDAEFRERGFNLANKVDLAVSTWCFRHLADPTGTFAQFMNLLRPKGYLALDGFFLLHENEHMSGDRIVPIRHMTQLCLDTKARFLTIHNSSARSLNHFILQKSDAAVCRLPMRYIDTSYVDDKCQVGSKCVTRFARDAQSRDKEGFNIPSFRLLERDQIYGDKAMYERFKKYEMFTSPHLVWRPLQEKDRHLLSPHLHQAAVNNDLQKVQEYLDLGDNIDESDSTGCTALHISIEKGFYELFKLLLKRGAHTGLSNGKSLTPLSMAAQLDKEGQFLQQLIDAGANVNAQHLDSCQTPLDYAISAENLTAIKILIKAGAELSEDNQQALKDPVFALLYE